MRQCIEQQRSLRDSKQKKMFLTYQDQYNADPVVITSLTVVTTLIRSLIDS